MSDQTTDPPSTQQTLTLQEALDLAVKHQTAGEFTQAESIYRQILQAHPDQPQALHLLGVIAHQRGENEQAVDLIEKAISINPTYADAYSNLGIVLKALGRLDDAVTRFEKALSIKPDFAEAHCNLGIALDELGQFEKAAFSYRQAIKIKPDYPEAHNNLGMVLCELGMLDEALACSHKALSLLPNFAEAHFAIGNTLVALKQFDKAIDLYNKAIKLKPNLVDGYSNLGGALMMLGRLEEALDIQKKAIEINPNYFQGYNNLGVTQMYLGEHEEAISNYREAITLKSNYVDAGRNLLLVFMYVPGLSAEELFAEHKRFSENHTRDIALPEEGLRNDLSLDRPLRIGYLSSDFRDHPVGHNVLPLLTSHDREQFEVHCYADVRHPDAITDKIRSSVDHWNSIRGKADAEVAAMVRVDEIDILICLAGRFDDNRPLVCAHRAAPVQVSFHDGATSGLEEMDYWLTDAFLNPPDTKEKFTEDLYRLPVFYQYPQIEDAPPVATPPSEQADFITFGSFNNPAKVNKELIELWSKVLKAVPNSRLLLKYKNWYEQVSLRESMLTKFAVYEIDEDRVNFVVKQDTMFEHLGNYNEVDIALDPFPFNGATTTYQALWMGVPVITLAGETFNSRIAGSILYHSGLDDLIVDTPEDYIACASALAADGVRLGKLRLSLREQIIRSPLCDAPAYALTVESAYREMWQTWCANVGDNR